MSRVKFLIIATFVFSLNICFSQSFGKLNSFDTPEKKLEYLFNQQKLFTDPNKPDSALYVLNIALEIARENRLKEKESNTLRKISMVYYRQKDFEKCVDFNLQSIAISELIDDYKGQANAYHRIGLVKYINRNFVDANLYLGKAVENARMTNDSSQMAQSYLTIGACQYQNGNYPEALDAFQSSLILSKDTTVQANSLNNIGNIQDELKNYDLALKYLGQALELKELTNDKKGAAGTRENMATVYSKKGEFEKALELYKEILEFRKSKGEEAGMSTTLMNIGYGYEKLGRFQNALDYYSQSLKLLYKLDDNRNLSTCLNNIGDIYYAMGKFDQAIDSSAKSLEIGKKLNSKTSIKSSAYSLTKSFVKQNNFREAYYNHVLYAEMKDSLFNEESAKLLQEMETKYQTEKKQQEIEKQALTIDKQKAQSRSQQIMLLAMLGGMVLVILIAVQVYRGYKQKKKANALLSAKNDEITLQKKEIEEKNLNIMDSIRYAKRIQQTILPRDQFVEKHLPESFILYKPKDIVSGDFYWFEKVGRKVFVAAVDCTGHGVPGAFVSIVGYNNLNRTVMEFHLTKPGDILNKLNDLVVDTFVRHSDSDVKDGMDMSLVSIDLDSKQVEFAGAQNPIYVANRNSIEEVKADKQPIGSSLEPKVFENNVVQVQTGDMVYLFSDGYIDQFGGPQGKKFMRKRFKEMLGTICNLDVKTQKQHLDNTIVDWMKNEEQLDDILVIGIRIT